MIQICFTYADRPAEVIRRDESDLRPGHWNKLGVSIDVIHRAETIVATNLNTGKSVMFKNRYGPAAGMLDEILTPQAAEVMKEERKVFNYPSNRLPKTEEPKTVKVNFHVSEQDLDDLMKDVRRELGLALDRMTQGWKMNVTDGKLTLRPTERFGGTVSLLTDKPSGIHPAITNDVGPVLKQPATVVCQCPIADLLSNGHLDGCPDKK